MEIFNLKNLSFTYNKAKSPTLKNIDLKVFEGEFLLIIGESGSGKTTLLRMLKKELTPFGKTDGEIFYKGNKIEDLSPLESSAEIGFIMQDPDAQIVTDKVYSELAFGLENLCADKEIIRAKVSEFAAYFGLKDDFDRKTSTLSGGEKQLLNLASVMAMSPEVIVLDEPTAQLDPISAVEFLSAVKRLNDDFGTTVIIAEHHLEKLFPIADRVVCIENGQIECVDTPRTICAKLQGKRIAQTLPTPARVFNELSRDGECPVTVKEGRGLLKQYRFKSPDNTRKQTDSNIVLECKDLWFRYSKDGRDVLKGLDLKVYKSEIYAVVGENGCGKSTLLKTLNKIVKPYRGKIKSNLKCAYLPQNSKDLFVKDTLRDDLKLCGKPFDELCERFSLSGLLDMHPYDLSGGELQRAAIVKLLLFEPEIIMLDEPTKGLDVFSKQNIGRFLRELTAIGKTILIVTHDLEFAAEYADRCGLIFDGIITTEGRSRQFFCSNTYYTTPAAAMSRGIIPNALTVEDIINCIDIKGSEL